MKTKPTRNYTKEYVKQMIDKMQKDRIQTVKAKISEIYILIFF